MSPVFTKVNPGDPIQAHQLNQVIDALIGTSGQGVPIAISAVNDALNYALTVQNDETGNSRALNVIKSDGTLLIRGDASGVSLGTPLNLQPGSVPGAALADAGVTNAKLGPDVARANLLTNGGFAIWQRGNGPFTANGQYSADRWVIQLAGGATITLSRQVGAGGNPASPCIGGPFTGTNGVLEQTLPKADAPTVYGTTLTFSASVQCNAANAAQLRFFIVGGASAGTIVGTAHPGDSNWHTLTVTGLIPSDATNLGIDLYLTNSCTVYMGQANLVVGSQPANYVPLHPADDLARCLRYYEIHGTPSNSGQTEIALGQCYSGTSALVFLKYAVQKPVVPTTTVTGTPSLNNSGGGAIPITGASGINSGVNSGGLNTVVASGLVAGNATRLTATGANQYVVLEANP